MDLLPWSVLVILGVLSYISFVLFLKPRNPNHDDLPPGSTGWPIVGESLNFVSAGKNGKPESFIRGRMSKYSPEVFKTCIAGHKMAVVCGASGNKMVFANEKNAIGVWWPSTIKNILTYNSSSLSEDGKMRNSLSQYLKPEAIKNYVPIMDHMIKINMVRDLSTNANDQEIRAFPIFKKLAFSLSCKLFMNIEDPSIVDKLSAIFAKVTEGLMAVPIDFPGTTYNRAIKAANQIREELYPIIKQRRFDHQQATKLSADSNSNSNSNKYNDLLSFLVGASTNYQDDEIFLMEAADTIISLLVASHDTSSSAMSFIVYFLADHPHVYNRVLEEQMEIKRCKQDEELLTWDDLNKMKYSRCVLHEVLRLAPPIPGGFRQATHDFTYAGFTIPKGWKIFWSVHSTNKDPKYFENPEEFNPSRFEGKGPAAYTFVPFGSGPHMCPGSEYVRVELLIFMHNLVTGFRWEKLVQNEKIIANPISFPAQGLPIRLSMNDNS